MTPNDADAKGAGDRGGAGDDAPKQRFTSVVARTGRVVVGRLLPGSDLIRGLEAVCDENGLRYASITSAYGSLSRAAFKVLQVTPESSPRAVLVRQDIDRRVEFLAGQGLVCDDGQGGRATHLHGAVSDEESRVQGGHFEPDINIIYNNLDFVLVELLGVRLMRSWEPETETVEMTVHALEPGER